MQERESGEGKSGSKGRKLHEFVRRFVDPTDYQKVGAQVEQMRLQGLSNGTIFDAFSNGKGVGKSHVSGKYPQKEWKLKGS